MKKLFIATFVYLLLGLIFGAVYREITKFGGFVDPNTGVTDATALSVIHTHLLVLGAVVFTLLIFAEKLFQLSQHKIFNWFFVIYNIGLMITVTMFFTKGIIQVFVKPEDIKSIFAIIAGIAGLGHVVVSLGFVLLFVNCLLVAKKNNKNKKVNEQPKVVNQSFKDSQSELRK